MLLLAPSLAFAQSREDVLVDLVIEGGSPEHRAFFEENFRQEITAAGYTLRQSFDQQSDYTLAVSLSDEDPPDPAYINDNYQPYYLTLTLIETEKARQILQLEWGYTQVEEMYQWTLYLIYQAMANAPLTKLGSKVMTEVGKEFVSRNFYVYLGNSVSASYLRIFSADLFQADFLPFKYFGFSADLSAAWSQKYEYEMESGGAYCNFFSVSPWIGGWYPGERFVFNVKAGGRLNWYPEEKWQTYHKKNAYIFEPGIKAGAYVKAMNGRVLVGLGINCYFDLKTDKPYYTPAALEFAISWRVGLGEKRKERVVQSDIPARNSIDSVENSGSWEDGDTADSMYVDEASNTDEIFDNSFDNTTGNSLEDITN